MSTFRKIRSTGSPQLDLPAADESASLPGQLAHLLPELRAAMIEAIKRSTLSRHQIAGEMSHLLDRDVSKDVLDRYCAESAEGYRPPADALVAFCLVTHAMRPLHLVVQAARHVAVPLPAAAEERCLRTAVMRIGTEFGDVCRLAEEALQDNVVTAQEAADLRRELDDVVRRAAQMLQQLESLK